MSKQHYSSIAPKLAIEYIAPRDLTPSARNARRHSREQIAKLSAAIAEFGFSAPILIDAASTVIAGHARLEAAKSLGLDHVPCVRLEHLTEPQARALALADNRLAELASWDAELLAAELSTLTALDLAFSLDVVGFETGEIDVILDNKQQGSVSRDDQVPDLAPEAPPVTRSGDLWLLGSHRLLCGDGRDEASFDRLLGSDRAEVVFADPPYNVPVNGHVSGLGSVRHREFAMASGEMSESEFTSFLTQACRNMARFSQDGSIHFLCMDWRHLREILDAGRASQFELRNVCVWAKSNAGMGSLYRSQHEFVFVFKSGSGKHINNVQLGRHGRHRTNVWRYDGVNTFRPERDQELAMHPTVKPAAMVADAIMDCSHRHGIVLDPFAGSGTTIVAAERTGRCAAAMELDARYCDVAIQRWQTVTGQTARLADTGRSFGDVRTNRSSERSPK